MFARTLSRVQNNPLAFPSGAVGVRAHEDARSAAEMQAAPARREAAPLAGDAMQQCRKKTFSSKCQLLRFWVWVFFYKTRGWGFECPHEAETASVSRAHPEDSHEHYGKCLFA